MAHNYPVLLDVGELRIVIIGGGEVAVRKARGLLEAGAEKLRVVSPEFHQDMPLGVERISGPYQPEHLTDAKLVFAATSDAQVNDRVVEDAQSRAILSCRADADEVNPADFATPAMIRRDSLLIAVSTGGSPALAALIRDALEKQIDPRWIAMASFMRSFRPQIRAHGSLAPSRRREIFRTLATEDAMNMLHTRGADALRDWLIEQYPELKNLGSA